MKNLSIIVSVIALNIFHSFSFGQGNSNSVNNVKIYAVSWDAKYTVIRSVKNIKKLYSYYFQTEDIEMEKMFLDYKDCLGKLTTQKVILDSAKNNATSVLAELNFSNNQMVQVFFDNKGNYYFQDK